MKSIIPTLICIILSGCIQTKSIDDKSAVSIVQSDGSQRNGIILFKRSGFMYCPDAPPEIARSWDTNSKAFVKDATGNNVGAESALKALVVNLSNRNSATNVLVYSLNSLCFLAMNGSISEAKTGELFEKIIKATTKISTVEIAAAESARNLSETERNKSEATKNETAAEKAKADAQKNKTETQKLEAQLQLQRFNLNNNQIEIPK